MLPGLLFAVNWQECAFRVLLAQPGHPAVIGVLPDAAAAADDGHALLLQSAPVRSGRDMPAALQAWWQWTAWPGTTHADGDALLTAAAEGGYGALYSEGGVLVGEAGAPAQRVPQEICIRGRPLFRDALTRQDASASKRRSA